MSFGLFRFLHRLAGFKSATDDRHSVQEDLRREAKLQQALGGDAHSQLGQLEREMRRAEQEQSNE